MNQIEVISVKRRKLNAIDIRREPRTRKDDSEESRSAVLATIVPIMFVALMIAQYIIFGY